MPNNRGVPNVLESIESSPGNDLKMRLASALERVIAETDEAIVQKLQTVDDLGALAALVLMGLDRSPLPVDLRFRMAIKGAQRFQALIERTGGAVDTAGAASLMKTTDSVIRKMASRYKLLAFMQNGEWAFPAAQFDLSTHKLIAHLDEVLEVFAPEVDEDSRVIFCLSTYEGTGKNPLTLLAEGFPADILKQSAATLYEHGAR